MSENIPPSSGNVFADLGFQYPEEALVKAQLTRRIATVLRNRGLDPKQAAHLLGTSQSRVSSLLSGQLGGFTIDRLMRFLTKLNEEVQIIIRHVEGPAQLHLTLS